MKTTHNNQQTQLTETSVLLAIPSCVAFAALKKIEEKDIKCEYLGLKESDHIIFKLSYFEWQEKFVKAIISEMKEDQAAIILLLAIAGEIIVQASKQHKSEKEEAYIEYFKYPENNGSN